MEPYDDSRRIVDLVASFGSKNPPSGQHKRKNTAAARAKTGSSTSSQGQRLEPNGLRPTIARTIVLDALENATRAVWMPAKYIASSACNSTASHGDRYRALNDLWTAGLLIRTAGTRGRAFCAIKPEAPDDQYDTLRCHCGATCFH